jgi:hypothetical protein
MNQLLPTAEAQQTAKVEKLYPRLFSKCAMAHTHNFSLWPEKQIGHKRSGPIRENGKETFETPCNVPR